MSSPTPRHEWLDQLVELHVPSRLAAEWSALAEVPIVLFETATGRGRQLAGAARSSCIAGDGLVRWPECVPAAGWQSDSRHRCKRKGGLHLVVPVSSFGETLGCVVTGAVSEGQRGLSPDRLLLFEHFLGVIAHEMTHFLERSPNGRRAPADFPGIVGESAAFQDLRSELRRALAVRYPVLVLGESGTGKDLVAWLIHHRGERRAGAYISVNCAALPDQLLESELFGHRRGSFTGADQDKAGLFDAARGGTILLDEIQQMSLAAQAKLLRVVDTGEYRPLGGMLPQSSDARLIAATNADPEQNVADGRFRRDLYYRLRVLTIRMPSLREVRSDIPIVARHFARLISERDGLGERRITPAAMAALVAAPWPGNVRQLIHELERAILRCAGSEVQVENLSPELRTVARQPARLLEMRERVADAWERDEIRAGLDRTGWNVSRLAAEVGLSRRGLFKKIARHGLRRPRSTSRR